MLRLYNPHIVFFIGTKLDCNRMVQVQSYGSGFYSSPDLRHRSVTWDTLQSLGHDQSLPWLFEAWWVLDDTCKTKICDLWTGCVGSVPQRDKDDKNILDLSTAKLHLNLEIDKEELYWEQKARVDWLKIGDNNTWFFHRSTSQQKQLNRVSCLIQDNGHLAEDKAELVDVTTTYFEHLFASQGLGDPSPILRGVGAYITTVMNLTLIARFTLEEVYLTLKSMGPMKASGPNGFPTLFYQQYWHIGCPDVGAFCLECLNEDIQVHLVCGARISRHGSQVSHLLFVDNCILFGEAMVGGCSDSKTDFSEEIICSVQFYLLEFDTVHAKLHGCLIGPERWRPPEGSCLKVNFDAAFHAPTLMTCVGIVIKDNLGSVIGYASVVTMHIPSAFAAEALACYPAI
ncbi:hypothetical protein J1N35_002082 [Gossypium stocksii]|uniref:RNase H type-1 domain-containing protein n=1 Tax=Gossypium stocksii TaxID=47602 RepID=A0A9D3WKC4_9ROSI|nr:hypothetical protein J1N35_002082 [Gossypium stocksii]